MICRRAVFAGGLLLLAAVPLHGQVDPSGRWRTWHTAHFRVHAEAGLAGLVPQAAAEAERAYALLATELKPPRGIIDLVLADNGDFSNGFAATVPSNRITVYVAPPGTTTSLARYDHWLRLVLTHELVHIFHVDRADGVWRIMQSIFGRAPGLFPNAYQPSWVLEGIATYYESRFTDAGRVRGAFHDQLLAAAARGGRWPAPGDAVFTNPTWPAGSRPYAWGSRFFELARRTVADTVIPHFVDRTSRQLVALNVSRPFHAAAGVTVGDLWSRLQTDVRPASDRDRGAVMVRGLRAEPRPRLSPDGRWIAYRRHDDREVPHVTVIDRTTGATVAAHRATAIEGLAWIGDTLYVAQLGFDSPVRVVGDLYRWRPGGPWRRVTSRARVSEVFRAPGGGVGAVVLGAGSRRLVTQETAGGAWMPFPAPPADDWGRIAVSPDGEWVAGAHHAGARWDIVIWPVGHPERVTTVTSDPAVDADPTWAPDGQLLFVSERTGLPQIYAFHVASQRLSVLTDAPGGAREPAAAADGGLVYSTVLADGHAIVSGVTEPGRAAPSSSEEVPAFVSASPPSLTETGYRAGAALRPQHWIPLVHGERDAGTFVGALTSGSDPVGRTAYAGYVTVAPSTGRWEAALAVQHTRWRSWSLDITAGQTWDFGGLARSAAGTVVPVSFRERSAEAGVRYRWRAWRTGLAFRAGSFLEQDALVNDGADPLPVTPANRTFAGGVLSVSGSYVEAPPLAISLENGVSVAALVLRRWQLGGPGWSTEVRTNVNGYLALPLPGFAHWVLAGRASLGVTGGPTPTVYTLGGESGSVLDLVPGYSLGSGRRKFPLRGYERGTERFTRAFVGVIELRAPLVVVGRSIAKLPILLDRLSASLFGEIGGGWNAGQSAVLAEYRDVGAEFVLDAGIGSSVSLRTRVGGAVALADGLGSERGAARAYVAFGSSF